MCSGRGKILKGGKLKGIGMDPVPEEKAFDLRGIDLSPRGKRTSLFTSGFERRAHPGSGNTGRTA